MTIKQRIQAELKAIREGTDNPGPDIGDWDRLLLLLEVAFCDHRFVTKRAGGDPAEPGSNEAVRVCEVCGLEADEGD